MLYRRVVPNRCIHRSRLVPASEVVSERRARWIEQPGRGHNLPLTGVDEHESETYFPMLGMAIRVIDPGEPSSTYHWETEQEDFLVLSGEAILIVEGQERWLKQWDFVHCPPETRPLWGAATPLRPPLPAHGSSRRTARGGSTARTKRPRATTRAHLRTLRTAHSPTRGSRRRTPRAIATACCPASRRAGS